MTVFNKQLKVDNRKVQIRLAPFTADYKIVEYRIDESELNWLSRKFNKWHSLKYYQNPTNIDLTFLDNFILQCYWEPYIVKKNTIWKVKEQFKTMNDINRFKNEQICKYNDIVEERNKLLSYEY